MPSYDLVYNVFSVANASTRSASWATDLWSSGRVWSVRHTWAALHRTDGRSVGWQGEWYVWIYFGLISKVFVRIKDSLGRSRNTDHQPARTRDGDAKASINLSMLPTGPEKRQVDVNSNAAAEESAQHFNGRQYYLKKEALWIVSVHQQNYVAIFLALTG